MTCPATKIKETLRGIEGREEWRIALSGKMCSGKTRTALQLVEDIPGMIRLNFAQGVYQIARDYFGMVEKDRDLLQKIGQTVKSIDPDVWVKHLLREIDKNSHCPVVIDDLRFPNELKALKERGFFLVRLEVSPDLQSQRIEELYPDQAPARREDISECALDGQLDQFDLVIYL